MSKRGVLFLPIAYITIYLFRCIGTFNVSFLIKDVEVHPEENSALPWVFPRGQ